MCEAHARRIRSAIAMMIAALVAIATVGCTSSEPSVPDTGPDITASIVELQASGQSASMLVEAPGATSGYDAARVSVDETTRLVRYGPADGLKEASIDDLAVGGVIEVWFDGPVAESYPVQAKAGTIRILQ